MAHKRIRLLFAVVLLFTLMAGLTPQGPAHGAAAGSEFSAASKVLSQFGTVGKWTVQEPPVYAPVPCKYPSGTNSSVAAKVPNVLIYPRAGLASEVVEVTTSLKRRLPDGSLQSTGTNHSYTTLTGTATAAKPYETAPPGSSHYVFGDLGSTLVQTMTIHWGFSGRVELLLTQYRTTLEGPPDQDFAITDACYPAMPASGLLDLTTLSVDQRVNFYFYRMPYDPVLGVGIYLDGGFLANAPTNLYGNGGWNVRIPAIPMGQHTLKASRYGRSVSKTFTVIPRIVVKPRTTHLRGEIVDVSLRGFAKYETVRIRWKKGTSWVQIATVKTSGTGSANINVKVPTWVPDGLTSVRGDGEYGHAQTSQVKVMGGPFTSSTMKPTPSATPTQTPSPTETSVPATSTTEPTATPASTEQPVTPQVTVTAQPTETATPVVEPTEEPAATETPAFEPTAIPSESPEATETTG